MKNYLFIPPQSFQKNDVERPAKDSEKRTMTTIEDLME
jgi:hypothetical protein